MPVPRQRFPEGKPQNETGVLDGVVGVDLVVSGQTEPQVDRGVPGEGFKHVL
jgi:hypothetical protein